MERGGEQLNKNELLSEVLSILLILEKRAQKNREECRKYGNNLMADQYQGRALGYEDAAALIPQALVRQAEKTEKEDDEN